MSTFVEIKNAIDRQAEAFEEFKKVNDKRIDEVDKGNESKAAELAEKLVKIDADVQNWNKTKGQLETEMQLNRERLEELETRASTPRKTPEEKAQDEYTETFIDWFRHKAHSSMHEQKMQQLMKKDLAIGAGATGGFAVPEVIGREIERLEKLFSPVRRLVKVVQTSTSDYKELVNIRGTTAGWVGEADTRNATNTPALREAVPTHGELYAYPQTSEWALDDMFFDPAAWLAEEVAQQFAIEEGEAVISGNGTSKPTGMLNTTPTDVDDFGSPLRAAAVYQFVESQSGTSPGTAIVMGDALIDLVYKLNSAYRVGATWVMNSATTGSIRKMKDSDGQYLWQPSLQAGQPAMLLGFPVETWEQMPDVGANEFPVGFGNFRRGYLLADRVGLRITRDEVTNIGFVKFYVRRREGGIVLNNNAIKFLRTVTT
jgi:HK97 family phage major capsid protein